MARQLKKENCRLVIAAQPSTLRLEYRVADGDLTEPPQRLKLKDIQMSQTLADVWQASIAAARTAEGI